MRRPLLLCALLTLLVLTVGGVGIARTLAQDGTPMSTPAGVDGMTLTFVEHNDAETVVDVGDTRTSVGDMRVWGPNPLYDDSNTTDTGARTQGACIALNESFDCVLTESIVFPDGSTLELQGVGPGTGSSRRTIVGGSGGYLGATGVMTVEPSADLRLWKKSITFGSR